MSAFDWTNGIVAIYGSSGPVGTGFFVSPDGLILTCAHVLAQAGWSYQAWDEAVQIRFRASRRFASALVQATCFSSQTEGDYALLALEGPLPDGVEVLGLWQATAAAGQATAMFGYPASFDEGLRGEGSALGLVTQDGRSILQLRSTETTRGYSGGPVWHPAWQRVIGLVLRGLEADALGRLAYTSFAIPAEVVVAQCPDRLALTPPESFIARATRHISGANRDLIDGYTARPFFGRDQALEELDRWRAENDAGRMVVTALAGFGKTALLANWLRRQALGDFVASHFFSNRDDNLRPLANGYAHLLGQLSLYYGLPDETLPDENAREARLRALIDQHDPAGDRPLIILLDALDECDQPFQLPLPGVLPTGVYVVASARASDLADDGGLPAYLEGWSEGAAHIHLERLPAVAQAGWLGAAGDGILLPESQDSDFLTKLDEVSGGYPLYLRYLLDDLVAAKQAGRSAEALLDQPAKGFGDYAARQLKGLARAIGREKEMQDFFVLLAVARYPLTEDEVTALTELTIFDLADLPPGLTRWLNISHDGQRRRQFALAHARLTDEFENALRGAAAAKRVELLAWCAQVADHRSPYALRYRADLLLMAEAYDALHEVALDGQYAALQRSVLPAEPDLPLRCVRLALEAAAEQGQAVRIAAALAEYAGRVQAVRGASPLAALRATPGPTGLSTALTMVDANDAEERLLWLLLLAWELDDTGRSEEAERTVSRLQAGPLPPLDGSEANVALRLLGRLLPRWPVMLNAAAAQLLEDLQLDRLAHDLLAGEWFDDAIGLIETIRDPGGRDTLRRRIAVAMAAAGDQETADRLAASMTDAWQRSLALRRMADDAAGDGQLALASRYLQRVGHGGLLAGGLARIAQAYAADGQADEAAARFAQARQAAGALNDATDRAYAFRDLALALHGANLADEAVGAVGITLEAAGQIADLEARETLLARIAHCQAQIGLVDDALSTTTKIEDGDWRADTLYDMSLGLSAAGRPADALAVSDQLEDERDRSMLVARVVADQAWAGDFPGAGQTFEQIDLVEDQIWALNHMAKAQAQDGRVEMAKKSLQGAAARMDQVDDSFRANALADMAEVYAVCGQGTAAAESFTAAVEAAKKVARASRRHAALVNIAQAQARNGEHQAARGTLAELLIELAATAVHAGDPERLPGLVVEVLSDIGLTLAGAGDVEGARETLAAALAAIERLPEESDRDELLATVGMAQAKAGLKEAAEKTKAMAGDLWTVDQIEQQIALNRLAQGVLQQAMTITAQIDHPELAAANHGAIAVAAWQAGQEPLATSNFEAALERAAEAGSDNERAQILAQIAADQARAGRRDEAEKTLAMALEAAEQVDVRLQDLLVGRVAEVQALSGFADQALVTLEGIQGDIWRAFARRTVAVAFARAGDLPNARQAAATLADADLLARVNMAMAAAAHAQGDEGLVTGFLSEAEQRVNELWAKDNRYEMLSDLAVTAARVGRASEAVRLARQVTADRDRHLPAIALALAESGDVKYLNQVLSLCTGDLATSLAVCPAIARRHPTQARAVADYVAGQRWS